MNPDHAREVLLRYRPGARDDLDDPEIAQALALTKNDAALREWFEAHCAFQLEMRKKLRSIAVPDSLRERIRASRKIVPIPLWKRYPVWAAAAAIMLLAGLTVLVVEQRASPNQFARYEARVVGGAVREYHMEVVTKDMGELRKHLAAKGAPVDYTVPDSLAALNLSGGSALKWRSHPIGMVCFDRGDRQMLYLFVARRDAFKDPPGSRPQVSRMADVVSVSWSEGDKCYTLAGPGDSTVFRQYL